MEKKIIIGKASEGDVRYTYPILLNPIFMHQEAQHIASISLLIIYRIVPFSQTSSWPHTTRSKLSYTSFTIWLDIVEISTAANPFTI